MYVRRGLRVPPFVLGGAQERARRAGLEDVAAMVGFGAAAEEVAATLADEATRNAAQSDRIAAAAVALDGVVRVGPTDPPRRLPHLVCLTVEGLEAEPILLALDQRGVAVHSGSACSSEMLEPSPVLLAMGADADRSLRISVGWNTTDEDADAFGPAFADALTGLRALRG
jgi:cysteine desulfurase